jgi:hypothetical protein
LPDYVESSAKEPILIMLDGEAVAMLVGINGGEKRGPAKLRDILREAWHEYDEHGGTSHEQFWDELAKEVTLAKKKRAK